MGGLPRPSSFAFRRHSKHLEIRSRLPYKDPVRPQQYLQYHTKIQFQITIQIPVRPVKHSRITRCPPSAHPAPTRTQPPPPPPAPTGRPPAPTGRPPAPTRQSGTTMESSNRSLFTVISKVFGFYTAMFSLFLVVGGYLDLGPWKLVFFNCGHGTLIRGVQAPWRGYHQTFWERWILDGE